MVISKSVGYFVAYSSLTVALFGYCINDSLTKSFDFNTFLIEITDGYKLGVLINFIVLLFFTFDKALQLLLFGELRIIETEHLIERLPIFSLNLFFNLATNDNNLLLTIILLGFAISFKIFHVILIDRLDFMSMKIANSPSDTKVKMLMRYIGCFYFWLNFVFIVLDFSIAKFLVYDVFQGINSVTCLLFGFQFAVQGVEALTYWSKLLLNIYELMVYKIGGEEEEDETTGSLHDDAIHDDLTNEIDFDDEDDNEERVWENKPYFSKGIDIASASLKATSYLCFIYLLTFHSGLSLPLSMLQGTYSSLKQAYTEITQLMAFIESSKRLDSQLPTATKEELESSDNLCIICREDMHSTDEYERIFKKPLALRKSPKKLGCSHILHMGCLKEWMERSDSCPLCRRKVFESATPDNLPSQGGPTPAPVPPAAAAAAAVAAAAAQNTQPLNAQPPFNHPAEDLERRLEEFSNILNRRSQSTPSTQPDVGEEIIEIDSGSFGELPVEGSSMSEQPQIRRASSEGSYQTIRLPSTAILPPNWIILPLESPGSSSNGQADTSETIEKTYGVNFSTTHQGTLKVKKKVPKTELTLIRPS